MSDSALLPQAETLVIDSATGAYRPAFPISNAGALDHSHTGPFATQNDYVTVVNQAQIVITASHSVGSLDTDRTLGTAFYVSPTILCSARHNLFAPKTSKTVTGPRKFSTDCNAVNPAINTVVQLQDLDAIPDEAIRGKFWDKIIDIDPLDTSNQVYPSDFVFLRAPIASAHYLLPQTQLPNYVAVIGYPSDIPPGLFKQVMTAFNSELGTKNACPASILRNDNRILAHNASTVKGVSGGPLVDVNTGHFVGIHTTGSSEGDYTHNVAVSVLHPVFKLMYKELVLPTLPPADQQIVRASYVN